MRVFCAKKGGEAHRKHMSFPPPFLPPLLPPSPPYPYSPSWNASGCAVVEVHDVLFHAARQAHRATSDDLAHAATPYGLLAVGVVLCLAGYPALRLAVGLGAFGTGLVGTVRLLEMGGAKVGCDVVTLAVVFGGGLSALVAVFATRMLSTALGAAAAGVGVGAVFAACGGACNVDAWPGAPRVVGMSVVPFWVSILTASVLGAVVARKRHREVLATTAALLGGFGVAVAVRSIATSNGGGGGGGSDGPVPSWLFVTLLLSCAGVGLAVQAYVVRSIRKRKEEKKARRAAAQ